MPVKASAAVFSAATCHFRSLVPFALLAMMCATKAPAPAGVVGSVAARRLQAAAYASFIRPRDKAGAAP
jgi:hypothetical protein